ncbi:hypothetical protein N9V91_03520 [Acidimicrobiaceae bacterium]|nr:hypothetical protein [Acidimicrobiaceae bacterium]
MCLVPKFRAPGRESVAQAEATARHRPAARGVGELNRNGGDPDPKIEGSNLVDLGLDPFGGGKGHRSNVEGSTFAVSTVWTSLVQICTQL